MKTLLYANRAEPKSISVISILLAAALGNTRLHFVVCNVACIGSVISLLRKIFGVSLAFKMVDEKIITGVKMFMS